MLQSTLSRRPISSTLPAISIATLALTGGLANGESDISVTVLHPSNATNTSQIWDGTGSSQIGYATFPEGWRALIWNGTQDDFVDLHPKSELFEASWAYGASVDQQVGIARVTNSSLTDRAALWSGTADSFVNLHPPAALWSVALRVENGQQIGYGQFSGVSHALLWSSTVDSMVDLHPAGMSGSWARGLDANEQVGWVLAPQFQFQAALWTGSADSFVNLHPTSEGSTWSQVFNTDNGQQGGFAKFGPDHFAALWTGTAESYINMNPEGATRSEILDVFQGYQVGAARFSSSFDTAALWMGTPESYIDLSASLDANWTSAAASSVWIEGTTLNIGGWGTNSLTGNREALLWRMDIPGAGPCNPADVAEPFGQLNFFDVSEFIAIFSAGDSAADINADGQFNFFDISAFISLFSSGCP